MQQVVLKKEKIYVVCLNQLSSCVLECGGGGGVLLCLDQLIFSGVSSNMKGVMRGQSGVATLSCVNMSEVHACTSNSLWT